MFPNLNASLESILQSGEVDIGTLRRLNDALRKAADVGYQTPSTGGGAYAPIVPQSIEPVLTSTTFTEKHLTLWKSIAKQPVYNTVHEASRVKEYGLPVDPFISEGGVPAASLAELDKVVVRVKYLAEKRELTDVMTMVGILGANTQALGLETDLGTKALLGKIESALWHADSTVNPLAFDGIVKQIIDGGNVSDLDGAAIDFDTIQDVLGNLGGPPYFAFPDTCWVDSRTHQSLINQARAFGRHDQVQLGPNDELTLGVEKLKVAGSVVGAVKIEPAPFLSSYQKLPTAASSAGTSVPATPVIKTQPVHDGGLTGTSKWAAADAADYYYKIIGVGPTGYSAPLKTAAVSVVAGQKIKFEVNETPDANTVYFKVWRSRCDSTGAEGPYEWLANVKVNTDGAGNSTRIIDLNAARPGSGKAIIGSTNPELMYVARLLDLIRRPLAQTATSQPFLLMLFGSPFVKVPSKFWAIKNVGS